MPPLLTTEQAYESALRFVAEYYARERILPLFLMLHSMGWEPRDNPNITYDPASWPEWQGCVRETLDGAPLPEIPEPTR